MNMLEEAKRQQAIARAKHRLITRYGAVISISAHDANGIPSETKVTFRKGHVMTDKSFKVLLPAASKWADVVTALTGESP